MTIPEAQLTAKFQHKRSRQAERHVQRSRNGAQSSAGRASSSVSRLRCRSIRRLHLLRSCWMVPGVDFLVYAFAGGAMPQPEEYGSNRQWQSVRNRSVQRRRRILKLTGRSGPLLSWILLCVFLSFLVSLFSVSSSFLFVFLLFLVIVSKSEVDEPVPSSTVLPRSRYGLEDLLLVEVKSTTNPARPICPQ